MLHILTYREEGAGLLPRRPGVCLIDLAGLITTLLFFAHYEPKAPVAVLLAATALQYTISCAYHWLPQNEWRYKMDVTMITLLVAANYLPYWGMLLPEPEMLWRLSLLAAFTLVTCALRFLNIWKKLTATLYPALGLFGLVYSFNELAVWLPRTGLALFWLGNICYFMQFLIWMKERPNPLPNLVGYRVIQHTSLYCGTTLSCYVALEFL
jgi:channel protein (hemolysin III family)